MHTKLQTLVDAVHTFDLLTETEKQRIATLASEVEKELATIAFKLERTEKIKNTMGVLLESNIEELEQKRKALEAQKRDLEIEASLERVRTQAMGMKKPDDLLAICEVLYAELQTLGFSELRNAMINIHNDDERSFQNYDYSDEIGRSITPLYYSIHPVIEKQMKQVRSAPDAFSETVFGGKDLEEWKKFRKSRGEKDDPRIDGVSSLYYYFYSTGTGSIGISTFSAISEDKRDLLKRFRNVFDLSYQRYTDICIAEAQAREARIEASLERVRSRSMAMHTSAELGEAATLLYQELRSLGITHLFNCGYVLIDEDAKIQYAWMTHADGTIREAHQMPLTGDAVMNERYDRWKRKVPVFCQKVGGLDLKKHLMFVSGQTDPNSVAANVLPQMPDPTQFYCGNFSEGYLHLLTSEELSKESEHILSRFTSVFEITYRRFRDLERAETHAREAQIEASLERVRSRTLAMQKSEELAETAAVLFRQLIALGIAPNRLYIAILKDESGDAEFWITDEDGSKVNSGFAANLHDNRSFQKMFEGWQTGKRSVTIDMQGEELQEYFQHLSSLQVPFKGGLSQKRRVQTIAFFSKGFLGIASPDEQPEENSSLLERFAAVFNLTMTRFNDLKLAEAQAHQAHLDLIQLQAEKRRAEEALAELRVTQEQLVQQEKLASLGQLTAGIAHEIKNPLNFVNNFSSVSVELVDEAIGEMKNVAPELHTGEIGQLLADVRSNLTKVVEHGTRADSIVKSMLHHSRGGNGRSEPTDLNALLKEYVNLAFHGMRAGKNPITVTIDFDLDESVGKTLLVAEDFSRVIVNLCQNAFDAMREKASSITGAQPSGSYIPKLTIRSRRDTQRIGIEIEDNGPGIPDTIRDKVMQPFFTTKKGTQGTGLGLSISHDIVKANRGELKMERNGSGGATFAIELPVEPRK